MKYILRMIIGRTMHSFLAYWIKSFPTQGMTRKINPRFSYIDQVASTFFSYADNCSEFDRSSINSSLIGVCVSYYMREYTNEMRFFH